MSCAFLPVILRSPATVFAHVVRIYTSATFGATDPSRTRLAPSWHYNYRHHAGGKRKGGRKSMTVIRDRSPGKNWAGNYAYRAERLHRPSTIEGVREIVAGAPRVRVLGSRHSFNDIADSSELLTLEGMPADVVFDRAAGTVSFNAGLKYGELVDALSAEGVGLHNLASLPHISVAGAVATATHGSGDANGNLATAVAGLQLVTSDGENLGGIPARGYSRSVFPRWGGAGARVGVKSRVTGEPERAEAGLFGATAAAVDRHPILGIDAAPCTPQLGRPGPWSDRLPHFRMGFTPSSGEELQAEYLLPRRHALEAIEAVRALAEGIRPILQVSEIRTVAADRLWMSMSYGEDAVGIHFTWKPEKEAVEGMLVRLERALAPFGAGPAWGKLFRWE